MYELLPWKQQAAFSFRMGRWEEDKPQGFEGFEGVFLVVGNLKSKLEVHRKKM